VVIVAVQPNSPAAQAGLRPGDIVESIAGTPVQKPDQVQQKVSAAAIGSSLPMGINRNGQSSTITVKPAPLPEQEPS
jgi:serine protease Do